MCKYWILPLNWKDEYHHNYLETWNQLNIDAKIAHSKLYGPLLPSQLILWFWLS